MDRLSEDIIYRILLHLPLTTIFTASLVSPAWRNLVYHSGPRSQTLLKPHLSLLRDRFGATVVPHKLPITAVKKLLIAYARQELFAQFVSTDTYSLAAVSAGWQDDCTAFPLQRRRWALSGNLLAWATRDRRVHIFETSYRPIRLLTTLKLPRRPIALALNNGYISIVDRSQLHLYQLLARGTTHFMVTKIHTLSTPVTHPSALAITPDTTSPPLTAVLGDDLLLMHPSHCLSQHRANFFSSSYNEKSPSTRTQWIITCPGTTLNLTGPLSFSMSGRHLALPRAYLGSAWSASSLTELARRRLHGLKPGQDLTEKEHDAHALFRHYRSITGSSTSTPCPRWTPKALDTADMEILDAVHVWDSYYIVTDVESRLVRIVSVAPFEARCILYTRSTLVGHPGYAVYPGAGRDGAGGYVCFMPGDGRVKVLPMAKVVEGVEGVGDRGWEMGWGCRDIAVGRGEVVGMFAAKDGVVLVFTERVVVLRFWTQQTGGEWKVDNAGGVSSRADQGRMARRCGVM